MVSADLEQYLHGKSHEYESCLKACLECMVACDMCSDACLNEEDANMLVECIRLDRDCADACNAASRAMSRGGPLSAELCRSCAEACERCAAECEKHSHHRHCTVCAEACRRCAAECHKMVGVAA